MLPLVHRGGRRTSLTAIFAEHRIPLGTPTYLIADHHLVPRGLNAARYFTRVAVNSPSTEYSTTVTFPVILVGESAESRAPL